MWNWVQIDYQLTVNWMPIEYWWSDTIEELHLKTGSSVVSLYKGKCLRSRTWDEFLQSPIIPMDCQFASIPINWQRLRIVRVPPMNIFRECSRPMRSLDSELSTNERPRFRPDSGLFPNFEPSNALPIKLFSMAAQMEFDSTANGMPIVFQLNATWLSFECQLIANWIQIDFKWNTNWLSIECQCIANWMSIDCQLYVNWLPM